MTNSNTIDPRPTDPWIGNPYRRFQCKNCDERFSPTKGEARPVVVSRHGGGSYNRAGRWYDITICETCAIDVVEHDPGHSMAVVERISVGSARQALARIGIDFVQCDHEGAYAELDRNDIHRCTRRAGHDGPHRQRNWTLTDDVDTPTAVAESPIVVTLGLTPTAMRMMAEAIGDKAADLEGDPDVVAELFRAANLLLVKADR